MSARPQTVPTAQHTLRQLKLVVPGGAITYYLATLQEFWRIAQGEGGSWGRCVQYLVFAKGDLLSPMLVFLAPLCLRLFVIQDYSTCCSWSWSDNYRLVYLRPIDAMDKGCGT
jgi:hypothetical protein